MIQRLPPLLTVVVLAATTSLFITQPAFAAPEDYHLNWFNTAEGNPAATYQSTINAIRATEIGMDSLSEITNSSSVIESSCSTALPANATALCWSSGDDTAEEWIPQGITTMNDSNGGGATKMIAAWYDGCSTGTVEKDWGIPNQGCQDGPNADEAQDKGVRVSIYTPGVGYRSVLLVEPFYNGSGNPSFHATHMHAGGIALYGNFLYVADTSYGIRVFDTRQIFNMNEGLSSKHEVKLGDKTQVGRHDNSWFSHGYAWVWPAVGEWRADGPVDGTDCLGVQNRLKYSYLSVDRVGHYLVAGEYCAPGRTQAGRFARWPLGSQSAISPSSGLANVWAVDAFNLPIDHVQGVVTVGNTVYVNASDGHDKFGKLWRYQISGTSLVNGVSIDAAKGCEDLSYDTTTGNIYSQAEYYGKRAMYRISSSSFPS